MICPKCRGAPEDYVTGTWVHKTIDGHPRMVCNTCGYVDERRVYVGGVYHGPPDKYQKNSGVKNEDWFGRTKNVLKNIYTKKRKRK